MQAVPDFPVLSEFDDPRSLLYGQGACLRFYTPPVEINYDTREWHTHGAVMTGPLLAHNGVMINRDAVGPERTKSELFGGGAPGDEEEVKLRIGSRALSADVLFRSAAMCGAYPLLQSLVSPLMNPHVGGHGFAAGDRSVLLKPIPEIKPSEANLSGEAVRSAVFWNKMGLLTYALRSVGDEDAVASWEEGLLDIVQEGKCELPFSGEKVAASDGQFFDITLVYFEGKGMQLPLIYPVAALPRNRPDVNQKLALLRRIQFELLVAWGANPTRMTEVGELLVLLGVPRYTARAAQEAPVQGANAGLGFRKRYRRMVDDSLSDLRRALMTYFGDVINVLEEPDRPSLLFSFANPKFALTDENQMLFADDFVYRAAGSVRSREFADMAARTVVSKGSELAFRYAAPLERLYRDRGIFALGLRLFLDYLKVGGLASQVSEVSSLGFRAVLERVTAECSLEFIAENQLAVGYRAMTLLSLVHGTWEYMRLHNVVGPLDIGDWTVVRGARAGADMTSLCLQVVGGKLKAFILSPEGAEEIPIEEGEEEEEGGSRAGARVGAPRRLTPERLSRIVGAMIKNKAAWGAVAVLVGLARNIPGFREILQSALTSGFRAYYEGERYTAALMTEAKVEAAKRAGKTLVRELEDGSWQGALVALVQMENVGFDSRVMGIATTSVGGAATMLGKVAYGAYQVYMEQRRVRRELGA